MVSLAQRQSCKASDAYIRLPLTAFRMELVSRADLFCQHDDQLGQDGRPRLKLYRAANYPITLDDVANLVQRGHSALYVSTVDHALVGKQLYENLEQLMNNDSIPPTERFGLMQAAVALEVDTAFRLIKPNRYVALSSKIAGHITQLMEHSDLVPRSMFNVVQHDYYTFTHVTNVAGYAVLLAEKLGVTDPAVREQLAAGALLHDIGKRFIPTEILCKPARLTQEERETIETHPLKGFLDLRDNKELSHAQRMMVYQHHERIDGTGYPVGILADEMHDWAKLLAIVDVFDAITSDRPYREPMPLEEAIEYLEYHAGSHYDQEMVRCWSSALQQP